MTDNGLRRNTLTISTDIERSDKFESFYTSYFSRTCDSVLVDTPSDPTRTFYMRPSSLPYCPIRKFLTLASKGIPAVQTHDAGSLFYTSVGTTVHEVFQAILGRGGRMYANWVCRHCKNVAPFTTYAKCPKCKKSGADVDHQEISVAKLRGWRGHLDGVIRDADGVLWVIDYKTTNLDFVSRADSKPHKSYVMQQKAYVVLLEEILGEPVAGWCLVYLARDNPVKRRRLFSCVVSDAEKKVIRKKLVHMAKLHGQLFKAETLADLKPLYENKLCASSVEHDEYFKYEGCEYRDVCFKRSAMVKHCKSVLRESTVLPLIQFMDKATRKTIYSE